MDEAEAPNRLDEEVDAESEEAPEGAEEEDDEEPLVFEAPVENPRNRRAGRMFCGASVGGLGALAIVLVLRGNLTEPAWLLIPILSTFALGGFFYALPLPTPWSEVRIWEDEIALYRGEGEAEEERAFHPHDVRLLSGERGLGFWHGEALVPRAVRLVTDHEEFTFRGEPEEDRLCYEALAGVCEAAVQIPFGGTVVVPNFIGPGGGTVRHQALLAADRMLGRRLRRTFAVATLLVLAPAAFVGVTLLLGPGRDPARHWRLVVAWGAVLALGGTILFWHGARLARRQRSLAETIRDPSRLVPFDGPETEPADDGDLVD